MNRNATWASTLTIHGAKAGPEMATSPSGAAKLLRYRTNAFIDRESPIPQQLRLRQQRLGRRAGEQPATTGSARCAAAPTGSHALAARLWHSGLRLRERRVSDHRGAFQFASAIIENETIENHRASARTSILIEAGRGGGIRVELMEDMC